MEEAVERVKPGDRKLIVAVFGGNESESLALAARLGAEVVKRGHILLTGGTGAATLSARERGTVKEQAIVGAQPGPWIGISRGPSGGRQAPRHQIAADGRSFQLQTDLDHKRNCLEACLCDAAIVLDGEAGTISEAVSSLWLRRPVVFIGDSWRRYDLDRPREQVRFAELIESGLGRVGAFFRQLPGDAPLDDLFDWDEIRARLSQRANYRWLASPVDEERTAASIAETFDLFEQSASRQGFFPALARYQTIAAAYNQWLPTV